MSIQNTAITGLKAAATDLQVSGNNIANVNTEGYVRERTILENSNVYGVGVGTTERVISVFAQNQLRRDITQVGELEAFTEKYLGTVYIEVGSALAKI